MQSLYLCLKRIFKLSNSGAPAATKVILAHYLQFYEQRLIECLAINMTSILLHLQYKANLDE